MLANLPLFDREEAQRHADAGIDLAAGHTPRMVVEFRNIARRIALSRLNREVSMDDVLKEVLRPGQTKNPLGNAAGAVFRKQPDFEFVREIKCERINAHCRSLKVWRYLGT
jgi:hypothetical protein